jgi:hypothetical protein
MRERFHHIEELFRDFTQGRACEVRMPLPQSASTSEADAMAWLVDEACGAKMSAN